MFENSEQIRVTLQQITQGIRDKFLKFIRRLKQIYSTEEQTFPGHFAQVHGKSIRRSKDTNILHFQTYFVKNLS